MRLDEDSSLHNVGALVRVSSTISQLVLLVAGLWLVYRVMQVFNIGRSNLNHILGLDVPPTPILTIDRLGATWASVRWRYSSSQRAPARHLIEIDGKLLETEKGQTKQVLRDLAPDTDYTVVVRAVSIHDRLSEPGIIHLHTLRYSGESTPTAGLKLQDVTTKKFASSKTKGRSEMDAAKSRIEEVQLELNATYALQEAATSEFNNSQSKLLQERDQLVENKRKADQSRGQLRTEINALEDTKHLLEVQKSKLLKRRKELETNLNEQLESQKQWESETHKLPKTLEGIEQQLTDIRTLKQRHGFELEVSLDNNNLQITEVERSIRTRTNDLRVLTQQREELTAKIAELGKRVDVGTGLVDEKVLKSVFGNTSVDQVVQKQILDDFALDKRLEEHWAQTQKALEQRYVNAYQQYEVASRALDTATAEAQAQTRAQAQVYALKAANSTQNSLTSSLVSRRSHSGSAPALTPGAGGRQSRPMSANIVDSFDVSSMSMNASVHSPYTDQYDGQFEEDVDKLMNPVADEHYLPKNLFGEDSGIDSSMSGSSVHGVEPYIPVTSAGSGSIVPGAPVSPFVHAAPTSSSLLQPTPSQSGLSNGHKMTHNPWFSPLRLSVDSSRSSSMFFNKEGRLSNDWAPTPPAQVSGTPGPLAQSPLVANSGFSNVIERPDQSPHSPMMVTNEDYMFEDPVRSPKGSPEKTRWGKLSMQGRTANFVRRLSIFSRKDKDPEKDEDSTLASSVDTSTTNG